VAERGQITVWFYVHALTGFSGRGGPWDPGVWMSAPGRSCTSGLLIRWKHAIALFALTPC